MDLPKCPLKADEWLTTKASCRNRIPRFTLYRVVKQLLPSTRAQMPAFAALCCWLLDTVPLLPCLPCPALAVAGLISCSRALKWDGHPGHWCLARGCGLWARASGLPRLRPPPSALRPPPPSLLYWGKAVAGGVRRGIALLRPAWKQPGRAQHTGPLLLKPAPAPQPGASAAIFSRLPPPSLEDCRGGRGGAAL